MSDRSPSRRAILAGCGGLAAAAFGGSALLDAGLVDGPELADRTRVWRQQWGDPSLSKFAPVALDPSTLSPGWSVRPSVEADRPYDLHVSCLARNRTVVRQGNVLRSYDREDGSLAWERTFDPGALGAVARVGETLVVPASRGVHMLDAPTGVTEWVGQFETPGVLAPVTHRGDAYLPTGVTTPGDERYHVVQPSTGFRRWDFDADDGHATAAAGDRLAWLGDALTVTDRRGDRQWGADVEVPTYTYGGAIAVDENRVVVRDWRGEGQASVAAYDTADGTRQWRVEGFRDEGLALSLGSEAVYGFAVSMASPGRLVALDAETGQRRWTTDRYAAARPPLVTTDWLYLPTREGLVVLDPATGREVARFFSGERIQSVAGVVDGVAVAAEGVVRTLRRAA
jgi:outer membrane protein assembly factor BamB